LERWAFCLEIYWVTGDLMVGQTQSSVRSLGAMNRNQLFAALIVIAFANGILVRVADGFRGHGVIESLSNTLDISAIVWVSLAVGVFMLLRAPAAGLAGRDTWVAIAASLLIAIPSAPFSWLALSGAAVYFLRTNQRDSMAQRGGWILLAVTIPMFWSRIVFSLFSGSILNFDAVLVSWIVGTKRAGNAIEFADGSGYLWIAPSCSSFANVSLAVLCFVLFHKMHTCGPVIGYLRWAILACASVVAINVMRLALIDIYSEHFDLLHGSTGATVTNWLTIVAVFGICAFGMRHDRLAIR
jgi:hypothetical protein